jgi:hypothetical protein
VIHTEIDSPVAILDENGKPVHFGWARAPYFQCDPDIPALPRRRFSKIDRYIIFSPTHLAVFKVMDNGYLGDISVCVISLRDKKRFSHTAISPFPLNLFDMPRSSESGSIRLHEKKILIDFIAMKGCARIIKVDRPQFDHHRNLRGEVVLLPPLNAESIVTTTPWRRDDSAFRYSLHSPWYATEGVMQLGTTEIAFTKGNAWGIFDWARGIRPRSDTRYWATATGISNGKLVSINVGFDSADSDQRTENAFFVDGKLHKLDQVTFHISPTNWLLPWHFTSNDSQLEMTFAPDMEWEEHNRMFLYFAKYRQLYGSFCGKALLADGSALDFNLTGFVERRRTRF